MRIAVFGTGGAGGYFGGRLAQAGQEVTFIARGEHLQAIRAQGLRVESTKGDFVVQPARATDKPADVGEVDFVLIGVKAWQVTDAAHAVQPMIGRHTFVMPIQNGVEAPAQLAAVLGAEHVIGGSAKIASFIAAPGHIRHIGGPGSVAFGELDNRRSERVQQLQEVFTQARVGAEIAGDLHQMLWEKFVFVASTGGLGAITRAPLGVVRSVPETRAMLEQAIE